MRIALLTDGIHPYVIGGMQKHSFYLAKYFALNKIEVHLYHTAPNFEEANQLSCFSDEEKKYIHSILIPFPKLDKFPGHYIRESYAYSSSIYDLLQKNKPVDFIYVQGLCGMKLLEMKNINTPIGINFHGLEMFQKAAGIKTKLEQYFFKGSVLKSMKNADVVFSLGGKLSKIISDQGISQNKIIEIPIGIDESWIRTQPLKVNSKRKFVFVGRYERRKGVEELTEVLKQLLLQQDFSIEFIGAIPEEKKLSSEKIIYHGAISNFKKIQDILSKVDVLVCPSYSEGMPTVILEAMASGLAIIASDVGAVSEQVDNTNGILVEPGNKDDLKKAILVFIEMPLEQLDKMKQSSVKKIKDRFLWEAIIDSTIKSIKKVIENSNRH